MKNLVILQHFFLNIGVEARKLKLYTQVNDKENIYFISDKSKLCIYNIPEEKVNKKIKKKIKFIEIKDEESILSENAEIISINYIVESDSLSLISNKGDIIMYDVGKKEVFFLLIKSLN
jgi:5'(3')-deoxyribonucleotidase